MFMVTFISDGEVPRVGSNHGGLLFCFRVEHHKEETFLREFSPGMSQTFT